MQLEQDVITRRRFQWMPSAQSLNLELGSRALIRPPQAGLASGVPSNPMLPAGFTYLGQFIAHDISSHRFTDSSNIPTLRLKNLYGAGSAMCPYLYVHYSGDLGETGSQPAPNDDLYFFKGIKLKLRRKFAKTRYVYDVHRTVEGLPLMADARNDQHFIISQLHVAFIRFHNAVVDFVVLNKPGITPSILARTARALVIAHYQYILVNHYVKSLVESPTLVGSLLRSKKNFVLFNVDKAPRLMPEFADAVLRLGHSQVAEIYLFPEQKFIYHEDAKKDLRGFKDRFKGNNLLEMDWAFFFEVEDNSKNVQPSSAIDYNLVAPMGGIPFYAQDKRDISIRDIDLSHQIPLGLEYAHFLARVKQDPTIPLSLQELRSVKGFDTADLERVPLWLYILLEAQIRHKGYKLGPLGSQIIAEQLIWVLRSDPLSFLNMPNFLPEEAFAEWRTFPEKLKIKIPYETTGQEIDLPFGIHDLLQFPDYFNKKIAVERPIFNHS